MNCVNFVVTGMFRSGTTLLAKILSAHPSMECISDPFAPYFKAFRNEFIKSSDPVLLESPLFDYVFDHVETELYKQKFNSSFNNTKISYPVSQLKDKIRSHCIPYAPKIISELDALNGETYGDLFNCFREILQKTYSHPDTEMIGFKEVWISEFISQILDFDKNVKVCVIVRDPRAVVASNYNSNSVYPILFLLRQWRKIAGEALVAKSKNPNRVLIVRYEDLVEKSDTTINYLSNFLKVSPHENMLDPNRFKDGNQKPWRQNSSHRMSELSKSKFNPTGIGLWKTKLSKDTIELIEQLCFFEMQRYDYKTHTSVNLNEVIPLVAYNQDLKNIASWITPYLGKYTKLQYFNEHNRLNYLNNLNRYREPEADSFFGISTDIVNELVKST